MHKWLFNIGEAYRMTSSEAPIVLCHPARLPNRWADIKRRPTDPKQPLCISQILLGVVRERQISILQIFWGEPTTNILKLKVLRHLFRSSSCVQEPPLLLGRQGGEMQLPIYRPYLSGWIGSWWLRVGARALVMTLWGGGEPPSLVPPGACNWDYGFLIPQVRSCVARDASLSSYRDHATSTWNSGNFIFSLADARLQMSFGSKSIVEEGESPAGAAITFWSLQLRPPVTVKSGRR